MTIFLIDEKRDIKKTYPELIADINKKEDIRQYINFDNPYKIFLEIIHSLIVGGSIVLLDPDFSETEIVNIGVRLPELNKVKKTGSVNIKNFKEILEKIEENKGSWELLLYTSGTTGRPKKVVHSWDTMTRHIKKGERFTKNVWAFAYNPTHFAGLQVFFQAFLNQNTMVYIFDTEKDNVGSILKKYSVTNISATPTFYRTIIPYLPILDSVERITLGGEKYDPLLKKELERIYPNARIRNVYASTEAGSLFGAEGEVFKINDVIKEKVRISEEGELLIHESLLGHSDDFELDNGWYHTSDIVEKEGDNGFRFISRKTEMINIGGYKVNPHDVEEEIKKIDGVIDVLVKPRSNRITGNILVSEIKISEVSSEKEIEHQIIQHLSKNLQRWKIPRIIKFVGEIERTRTGKKVRK